MGKDIKSTDPILSTQSYNFLWAHWKRRKKRLSPSKRERLLSSCLFVAKIQFDTLLSLLVPHLLGYDIYQPYYHITLPQVFYNSFPILKVYIIQKEIHYPLIYLHWIFTITYPVWWTWSLVYVFQTWISQATAGWQMQFKLGKKSSSSNSIFQTREMQKSSAYR